MKIKNPHKAKLGRPFQADLLAKREKREEEESLERKKRMCKNLSKQADELIEKGQTAEGRQCLASARELSAEIRELEKSKHPEQVEPKESKKRPNIFDDSYDPEDDIFDKSEDLLNEFDENGKRVKESIFRPVEVDDKTGEWKEWKEEEKSLLRRRRVTAV